MSLRPTAEDRALAQGYEMGKDEYRERIKTLEADNARLLAEAAELRRQNENFKFVDDARPNKRAHAYAATVCSSLGRNVWDVVMEGAESASALTQRVERLEVGLKSADKWFAKYYPMALVKPLIERILAEGTSSTPNGPQTGEPE